MPPFKHAAISGLDPAVQASVGTLLATLWQGLIEANGDAEKKSAAGAAFGVGLKQLEEAYSVALTQVALLGQSKAQ